MKAIYWVPHIVQAYLYHIHFDMVDAAASVLIVQGF
jgi:hypothetical protein